MMATLPLANISILPELPLQPEHSVITRYSSQSSIHEEYFTPRSSVQNSKISSDSDSTSTDDSISEDSDYEDFQIISNRKNVHFASRPPIPTTGIPVQLGNDEAQFFAFDTSGNTLKNISREKNNVNKSPRKRDRIRSLFNRKIHRSNSNTSNTNTNEWNEAVAKSIISMHQDMQDIINGFDQIDQPITDNPSSNSSEPTIKTPRLSFHERQRAKIQLMRMAQMLHPPNLLTCNIKESPYPYTDIVEPRNFKLHRAKEINPPENLLIQHKPFRHKKIRYRIQRSLLRMQHDLKKLKHDIYGKSTIKSHKELPSLDVQNYRNRLEKNLLEVRQQIAEYDRIHSSKKNHRTSISHIIAKMKGINPDITAQIEDYRTKLRPIEHIDENRKNELISAPFIPRRARYRPNNVKKDDDNQPIDSRFNPITFIDLNEESEIFFGSDIPFWDQPLDLTSCVPSSTLLCQSNDFILPTKVGFVDRLVYAFKVKQEDLKHTQSKQTRNHNQSNENNDEFYECMSDSIQERKLQPSISANEQESVDF